MKINMREENREWRSGKTNKLRHLYIYIYRIRWYGIRSQNIYEYELFIFIGVLAPLHISLFTRKQCRKEKFEQKKKKPETKHNTLGVVQWLWMRCTIGDWGLVYKWCNNFASCGEYWAIIIIWDRDFRKLTLINEEE